MIHKNNNTSNFIDSSVIAIAGHTGYVGKIVVNELSVAQIEHYKIPPFRNLTAEKINQETPAGKIMLINCTGRTLRQNVEDNFKIYQDNTESLMKLIEAFANRLHAVLHMSTNHLNASELVTEYAYAKKDSEEYLIKMASNYSFKAINLRLPTIWSAEYIKEGSLLDDISVTDIQNLNNQIRFPDSMVQISTDKRLGIEVKQFLSGEFDKVGFDNFNSWTGNVEQLIKLLRTEDNSGSNSIDELKQIFDHWRLYKLSF